MTNQSTSLLRGLCFTTAITLVFSSTVRAADAPATAPAVSQPAVVDKKENTKDVRQVFDIPYARLPEGKELLLDLYLPTNREKPRLIVFIHGGGWKTGSRKNSPTGFLVKNGYAVASIEYRLSTEATFPAQIFDCKGAVRWLRANAAQYGYDASRIGVMGESAGGYLTVLLGVTADVKELEGEVGGNLDQSSRVQAMADFFGPQDFILRSTDQPAITDRKGGLVYDLIGGAVKENPELARKASPVSYVTDDDPPLIIVHGTLDPQVHMNQSQRLYDLYQEHHLPVSLHPVEGGVHGGAPFHAPEVNALVLQFFNDALK